MNLTNRFTLFLLFFCLINTSSIFSADAAQDSKIFCVTMKIKGIPCFFLVFELDDQIKIVNVKDNSDTLNLSIRQPFNKDTRDIITSNGEKMPINKEDNRLIMSSCTSEYRLTKLPTKARSLCNQQ